MKVWREVGRVRVLNEYTIIDRVTYELPTGIRAEMFLKIQQPTACILAITEAQDIIVVEQYRPGPDKVLLELPGGAIEKGEDPLLGAIRELREETGYAGRMEFVTTCLDDAYSTAVRHCFVATGCQRVTDQRLDATEIINVRLVALVAFRTLLRSGELTDVEVGYLGLDYLKLL